MNWSEISSEINLPSEFLYEDPILDDIDETKTSLWATIEKKVRGSLKEEFGEIYTEDEKFDEIVKTLTQNVIKDPTLRELALEDEDW